jgi:hypothetical protein
MVKTHTHMKPLYMECNASMMGCGSVKYQGDKDEKRNREKLWALKMGPFKILASHFTRKRGFLCK